MQGAHEYADLLTTRQYGRLYVRVSGLAGRMTLEVYVIAEGANISANSLPPKELSAKVYGMRPDGRSCGWLRRGPWVADFDALISHLRTEVIERRRLQELKEIEGSALQKMREEEILASYAGYAK